MTPCAPVFDGVEPLETLGQSTRRRIEVPAPWGEALDGGFVVPSVVLLAGRPGMGKSTEALALAMAIGSPSARSVFVSAEMPVERVFATAQRAGGRLDHVFVSCVSDVLEIADILSNVQAPFVVVDSLHALRLPRASEAETHREAVALLKRIASETHAAILLLSHVSGDGTPAGAERIRHDVDATLILEQDAIVVDKNRDGPAPLRVARH